MTGSVLVAGSLSLDVVVREGRESRRLGGVVTYAGLSYLRLGVPVRAAFRARIEDEILAAPLARAGVELFSAASRETTSCVNRIEGDGRRQEMPRRAEPIGPGKLRAALDGGVGLVHLGPLHPGDIAVECLEAIAASAVSAGTRVALDVQGLVRRVEPGGAVTAVLSPLAEPFLAACGYLKASEEELSILEAGLGIDRVAIVARFGIEELVVTAGSRGGWVIGRSGETVSYTAPPIAGKADSTGAGDVFFAAYLVGRLWRGLGAAEAAALAAGIAGRQVAGEWIAPAELALGGKAE